MNAMHLAIFVHESIQQHIYSISSNKIASSIMGVLSSKGSIGVSFEVGDKSFLIINSHFTAG
jgi:hypothetical protein